MGSTDAGLASRDVRQRELVPPGRLARCHAVVVGVGAVGRQVALQLAATGVPAMTLYDPDTVGPENLAPQGFWESDVGARKVSAVADVCRRLLPRAELVARPERFRESAGRMVAQFARWLRGLPVTPDQTLNLLAAELSAADPVV